MLKQTHVAEHLDSDGAGCDEAKDSPAFRRRGTPRAADAVQVAEKVSSVSKYALELRAAAGRFSAAARAPSTRRAYATDLLTYVTWCAAHGFVPLPAAPGTLALYFAARAETGLSPSKLQRELAAI